MKFRFVSVLPHSLYTNQQFLTNIRSMPQTGALGKKHIVDSLSNLQNSNIYIDNVVLYIPECMAVFSTNYGFSDIEDYPDREWIMNNAVSDMDLRIVGKRMNYKSKYDESKHNYVFTLIKNLPYIASMKAVLIVNFDIDKIYENIVSRLNFSSDTEIFAISGSGDIVFQRKNSTVHKDILANNDFIDMLRNNQQNREISVNRKKYFVTAIFSEHMDSYIIGISSYKELTNMILTIRNIILIRYVKYDFKGTAAESNAEDARTLISENMAKIILGEKPIDEWDDVIAQYREMYGDAYVELATKQYNEYVK